MWPIIIGSVLIIGGLSGVVAGILTLRKDYEYTPGPCSTCGHKIAASALYCSHCGSELSRASSDETVPSETTGKPNADAPLQAHLSRTERGFTAMNAGRLALGLGAVAVWLIVTFGIAYGVTEWRSDDGPPVATQRAVAPPSTCDQLQTDLTNAQTDKAARVIVQLMDRENC